MWTPRPKKTAHAHAIEHLVAAERKAKRRRGRRRRAGAAAAAAALIAGGHHVATSGGGGDDAEVLRLHNQLRAGVGCDPLQANSGLDKAAQAKADDMARHHYMSHTWPDGSQWYSHLEKYYKGRKEGENIAEGFDSPGSVTTAWRNSPEHWRNISMCSYTDVGIAHNGGYWAVEFGAR